MTREYVINLLKNTKILQYEMKMSNDLCRKVNYNIRYCSDQVVKNKVWHLFV